MLVMIKHSRLSQLRWNADSARMKIYEASFVIASSHFRSKTLRLARIERATGMIKAVIDS